MISPLRRRLGANWLVDGYVMTIGLLIVLENLALIIMGPREHSLANLLPGRLMVAGIVVTYERLMIFCIAILAVLGLAAFMRFTNIGRAIRATAENPDAALAMGIDIRRVYTVTFGIGAALIGGVGGLLLADVSGVSDHRQRRAPEVVHCRHRRRAGQRVGGDDRGSATWTHRSLRTGRRLVRLAKLDHCRTGDRGACIPTIGAVQQVSHAAVGATV